MSIAESFTALFHHLEDQQEKLNAVRPLLAGIGELWLWDTEPLERAVLRLQELTNSQRTSSRLVGAERELQQEVAGTLRRLEDARAESERRLRRAGRAWVSWKLDLQLLVEVVQRSAGQVAEVRESLSLRRESARTLDARQAAASLWNKGSMVLCPLEQVQQEVRSLELLSSQCSRLIELEQSLIASLPKLVHACKTFLRRLGRLSIDTAPNEALFEDGRSELQLWIVQVSALTSKIEDVQSQSQALALQVLGEDQG